MNLRWMTDWRLEAFRVWEQMEEPEWANVHYEKPEFQDIAYYSAPKEETKIKCFRRGRSRVIRHF